MSRPNVTSNYTASPTSAPTSASQRIVAFIGEASTSFTTTESVVRGSGASDNLSHTATAIARVGNFSTTTDYAAPTDYSLASGHVTWVSGHGPATGATYWVTYTYAKSGADYAPAYFTDYNSILAKYGPITANAAPGALDAASYLTMAAQIAMSPGIGASQLIMVQLNPTTPGSPLLADFQAALTALQTTVPGANVKPYYIVPLIGRCSDADALSVNAACLAHCIQMADPAFLSERRAYSGMKSDATYNGLISALTALGAVNNSRITLLANFDPQLTIATGGVQQLVTLDGSFVAGAIAAFRSTQQVSQPAMNQLIQAFSGFNTNFSSTQIDNIDDLGGMVLENASGVITTVNDVTVDVASDIEKSIPTVETRDDLISGLRLQLKRTILGKRGSPTIPSQIENQVDIYLTGRRANGDISSYSPSTASLNSGSTTQYTVSFSYKPAGEVLQITVNFSIDLNLA